MTQLNRRFFTLLFQNKWLWASLALAFILVLINYKLITGEAVAVWDADGQFMPYQVLVSDFARQGQFLLWDCWTNAGLPSSGDPQVGAFSPIHLFIGLLFGGTTSSFIALWLFVWYLGGWGVLMLGRHFHLPVWAAFVVALQFLFVGIYITNAEHISWLIGFSFLPIIIWRLDVALHSQSYFNAVIAGAFWGLSALSAYPGFTIITCLYCFFWILGRLFFSRKFIDINMQTTKKAFLIFVSFLLVGIIILSPTYFSFLYDAAGTTTRVGVLSKEAVMTVNSLHLSAAASFSSPLLAIQQLYNEQLYVGTDISMTSIYSGILIFLAVFSIVNNHKSSWHWFLILLAFVMLGFALSTNLPFRAWLYDWFFPSRFFKHSSIFRAYFIFSITVLALLGIKDLSLKLKMSYSKKLFRNVSFSAFITVAAVFFVFVKATSTLANLGPAVHWAIVQLGFVWLGVTCVPFMFIEKFHQKALRLVPVLLLIIVLIDIVCTYQISSPVMRNETADAIARWKNLDKNHSDDLSLIAHGFNRKVSSCVGKSASCISLDNDQLIDKVPVFIAYAPQLDRFHLAMNANQLLKNMCIGTDRIWFSPTATKLLRTKDNFSHFENVMNSKGTVPLVIHSKAEMLNNVEYCAPDTNLKTKLLVAPSLIKMSTNIIEYLPAKLYIEVNAPSDGWLLVTDRWARAWHAEIDSKQVEMYGANFIFRAIQVKKGLQKIHFYYTPIAYPYLLILSWGTLLVVLLIAAKMGFKNGISL